MLTEYVNLQYQIGIYNKNVRDCIRSGDDWNNQLGISNKFEEVNYFEIIASSDKEVERIAEKNFPKRLGYVLDFVEKMKDTK